MGKIRLAKFSLLIILSLSILASVKGVPMSKSITSFGEIEYLMDTLSLKRFTGPKHFSNVNANQIAELFDMSKVWPWDETKIREVYRIRRDFKALLNRNIRAISNTSLDEWQTAFENNLLLKDAYGNLIYVLGWPQNYVVDIGNPDYQAWVANWIEEHIDLYGYDGVFADCSFDSLATQQWFGLSATPINPRTGTNWTDAEVRQAQIQLHLTIKRAIGSKLLVSNGIMEGTRFWRNYNGYMELLSNSSLDGIMSEALWYQYRGVWMTEEQWLNSLKMLVWFQDNFLQGKPERVYVPTCKIESFGGESYPLPLGVTGKQMATYALASTLLGIKTNQTYLCLQANPNFTKQVIQPLFDIEVGAPKNSYYVIEGTHVYARDFSNIKVLVNPTEHPYTIDLQGTFKTPDGWIVTDITMEPYSGGILTKT